MEQKRRHPTEMMRDFIAARRQFLIGNRPSCIGLTVELRAGVIPQPGKFMALRCNSPYPARLIEQSTPAQWQCSVCKRSWTEEPEPE